MDEIERRAWSITGRAAGNTISPGVSALCALAGMPLAESTSIGALAGSLTEEGFAAIATHRQNRTARMQQFADAAEEASGSVIEQLITEAATDPQRLELLAQAVENAMRALDDWKIELLARVFVHGQEGDRVDQAVVLVDIVRQLESVHIRVLKVISQWNPEHKEEDFETPADPPESGDIWLTHEIERADPAVAGGLTPLLARLSALGMVTDTEAANPEFVPHWALTEFGVECVRYLRERATQEN